MAGERPQIHKRRELPRGQIGRHGLNRRAVRVDGSQQRRERVAIGFGEAGQGVEGHEELVGFGFGYVEDQDWHFHVGGDVATKVAIDQLELAIGQFAR